MTGRLFISGPFTGATPIVRQLVKAVFEESGIEVLVKHGGVEEPAASLIDRADGVVFVLGATAPAIADVWGRTLVELELGYALHCRKPVLPVLLSVEDESLLSPAVASMRANIRRQLGDKLLVVEAIVDSPDAAAGQSPSQEAVDSTVHLLRSVASVGWRRFATLLASNKVFLSHAHADKPQAERIFDELLRHDLDPWVDKFQLKAGSDLARSIQRAIEASGALLVLLSKASVDSAWVQEEVIQALAIEASHDAESGGFILPVRLEPLELPQSLAFLQERLHVDLFGGASQFKAGIGKIVHALRTRHSPDPYLD